MQVCIEQKIIKEIRVIFYSAQLRAIELFKISLGEIDKYEARAIAKKLELNVAKNQIVRIYVCSKWRL